MTNRATIQSISDKYDSLSAHLNQQMSTVRNRLGGLLGLSHGGKRNLYDIYGYPESLAGNDGFEIMFVQASREGIANRVTWGLAKSCWRDGFEIYGSSKDDAEQILVDEITQLKKTNLIEKIERADILNRIGRFSVLYVGIPDGQSDLTQELGTVSGNPDNVLDQVYFVPYAYDEVEISKQVTDVTDPRFGQPEEYTLTRQVRDQGKDTGVNAIRVHWSRVIHLVENALTSDIEGLGAMEPVFNRILDLDKACGGSAEAYFRNAKGKIGYEIDPKFAADVLTDSTAKEAFQAGAEKYTNEMQDFTIAQGAKLITLPTPHASPLDTVKVLLWEISGYTGIPLRVLTGEGAGQLAGSEDQLAYNQIVKDRQNIKCTGWINRLFQIFTTAGMLKNLPEEYDIRFPVQEAATEKQLVENADKKASALLKTVQAKSQIGGDGIKLSSALASIGLADIEVEDVDIDLDDDNDDDNEGGEEV